MNAESDDEGEGRGLGFAILGPLRVIRDGRPLALGGPQQRAVLALLLIDADRPVPTERVADALWGESPPAGYTTTIQTYVFHLREALEPDRAKGAPARILVTEKGGYRLDTAGVRLDARVFEAAVTDAQADLHAGRSAEAVATLDPVDPRQQWRCQAGSAWACAGTSVSGAVVVSGAGTGATNLTLDGSGSSSTGAGRGEFVTA